MKRLKYSVLILAFVACASAQQKDLAPYVQQDSSYISAAEYAARREAVLKIMPQKGVAVFRSSEEYPRTPSSEFVFRQLNNILYLSGYAGENGTLVLSPAGIDIGGNNRRAILFLPARRESNEQWTGPQMGPDEAADLLGVAAYPSDSLTPCLQRILAGADTLYYDWLHPVLKESLPGEDLFAKHEQEETLEKDFPNITRILPTSFLVDSLRMIKSPAELALMQQAIDLSCEGHRAAMKAAHPGIYEYQLEAEFDHAIEAGGAEAPSYPDIVGSGPNSCFLHYSADRRQTKNGDIVLMDCGAEYHGYAADVTRTFPVNGTFSPEQRAIYQLVYDAQSAGIDEVKPGAAFYAPHKRAFAVIHAGLAKLGIINDPAWAKTDPMTIPLDDINTRDTAVFRYFMHGTSHTLGMDVHDTYGSRTLMTNEVLTVEPGIYIQEGSPCDKKWWNIGVRIEDDILVTSTGHRIMSACVPRLPDEIEALMKK
ncbi:MAG TPA: aminopeptidase P N-terminal domain-containing protein [Candidatus Kapabacteria bacterium]|nr:aminopeptidase P N-terminal domain-containing protein [Candidatus Kapabacteria bacterium]